MANNTLIASDNFASGSLAAGWGSAHGFAQKTVIVGSNPYYAEAGAPNTATAYGQVWTGATWPNDQTSEMTVQTLTPDGGAGAIVVLMLRWQAASQSGYQIEIVASSGNPYQLFVYKAVAGVFTQIGSTVVISGGVSSGSIFTASIQGSVITVYLNQKLLFVDADPTYTSGTPGFGCFASTTIAFAQVASWRGYSAVQQDGVWSRQGILNGLFPTSADISGFGAQAPTVLYDGNAQILSGTVYKMWFWCGASGADLGYAESSDGLSWTRYGSNLLTAGESATPQIFKVGSTYHLYTVSTNQSAVYHCTSSDGINWGTQTSIISGSGWYTAIVFFCAVLY